MSEEASQVLQTNPIGEIGGYLDLLAEISQDFARSKDINKTLERSLQRIMSYLNAEAASVFLLESNDHELVCHVSVGPHNITGVRLKFGEGIISQSIVEDRCVIVLDTLNNPKFSSLVDQQSGFKTKSILCAPLSTKKERIGAIELINKQSKDGQFEERDRQALQALASSAAMAINNARMTQALLDQERFQRELELAAELQESLLPKRRPSPFPIHAINRPARMVSGDFFDFFQLTDGRIIFDLGDVSGKGINAALLMAKTASLFRCLGKTVHEPGRLLSAINQEICETATRGMFVTMVAGVFDPEQGKLTLANAGHEPPLLRTSRGEYLSFPAEAPPLGIASDMFSSGAFPESKISLEDGTLHIFTDGVTEGLVDNSQLGLEGLKCVLDGIAERPIHDRLDHIVNIFQQSETPLHDDLTIMMIENQDKERR